jgi:hypothetical protein
LPLKGKPLAMTVGALQPNTPPSLVAIMEQDSPEHSAATKRVLVTRTADGRTHTQKFSDEFKSNPTSITIHDVNQDGLPDVVVLIPYEKVKVLLQAAGKEDFSEVDVLPPGGNAEQPWLSVADVNGDGKPELLLAQKNFVRAVVLRSETDKATKKETWSFVVKEQINGVSADSRIVGATPVRNGTNGIASIFLLDAERKSLSLCERDKSGTWQAVRNVLLPVSEFSELRSIGLGASNPNSLAFIGVNAVATMELNGQTWQLTELDGYETPIKDGHLTDVVTGDLNQDGRKDLVFLETVKSYLDLVTFEAPHKLVPANRWQVFEERTFRSRRNDSSEPREGVVADVTGDGKNDLIILVHDRILVYPQE